MKYHFFSAVLIAAAVALELSGIAASHRALGATLFTSGAACELWFWMRRGVHKKATPAKAAAK